MSKWTTEVILSQIEHYQGIQKRHNYKHPLWQKASVCLHELFAEMARRNI